MSLGSFAKHSIELIIVVGLLYVAFLVFYPGAVAVGQAASNSDVHLRGPRLRISPFGRGGGVAVIRPSRLK